MIEEVVCDIPATPWCSLVEILEDGLELRLVNSVGQAIIDEVSVDMWFFPKSLDESILLLLKFYCARWHIDV